MYEVVLMKSSSSDDENLKDSLIIFAKKSLLHISLMLIPRVYIYTTDGLFLLFAKATAAAMCLQTQSHFRKIKFSLPLQWMQHIWQSLLSDFGEVHYR